MGNQTIKNENKTGKLENKEWNQIMKFKNQKEWETKLKGVELDHEI